ncbi:MAG: hypothetical protein KR126chlam3_00343 [Chlamydiae bacterium]|nr:hypothetical protein [Chlamydiota bacterium]
MLSLHNDIEEQDDEQFTQIYTTLPSSNSTNFFPDLEHEAGPIPEILIALSYILATVHSQKGVTKNCTY